MDIKCAKCGEPWDAYGVRNGDMEPAEAKRFNKGEGCPACRFGECCPICSGSGKDSDSIKCCSHGTVSAWSPRTNVAHFRAGEFYTGFTPNVKHVRDPEDIRSVGAHQSRDGWADDYMIRCPTCDGKGEHLFPCGRCDGTGKLNLTEDEATDAAIEAARTALDASDEEPIGILIERGLL